MSQPLCSQVSRSQPLSLLEAAAGAVAALHDMAFSTLPIVVLNPPLLCPLGMAGGGGGEEGGGKLAQFVSNASFATLMLIYTFTELLDLSDQVCGWVGGWVGGDGVLSRQNSASGNRTAGTNSTPPGPLCRCRA